jgi:hypothetical protein
MIDERPDEKKAQSKPKEFPLVASHETYSEPEPILDPSCCFEEMDRGEGMGVDDIKTYHHTEK